MPSVRPIRGSRPNQMAGIVYRLMFEESPGVPWKERRHPCIDAGGALSLVTAPAITDLRGTSRGSSSIGRSPDRLWPLESPDDTAGHLLAIPTGETDYGPCMRYVCGKGHPPSGTTNGMPSASAVLVTAYHGSGGRHLTAGVRYGVASSVKRTRKYAQF